jgi:hypothetical protein
MPKVETKSAASVERRRDQRLDANRCEAWTTDNKPMAFPHESMTGWHQIADSEFPRPGLQPSPFTLQPSVAAPWKPI